MKITRFETLAMLWLGLVPMALASESTAPELAPPNRQPPVAAPGLLPEGVLSFAGGEEKATTVNASESEAHLTFLVTNISSGDITVVSAIGSCGCTTAKLPETPWLLAAGKSGPIEVTMKTQGKKGTVGKSVTVLTDRGTKLLQVNVTILEPSAGNTPVDRERNQLMAREDRQAIFKGDCVRCHVTPAAGKHGRDLFGAACGICHESTHRATMVPDLNSRIPGTPEYWREWIAHGRDGSLMPAFATVHGGPLTDPQIDELVDYLTHTRSAQRTEAAPQPVRASK